MVANPGEVMVSPTIGPFMVANPLLCDRQLELFVVLWSRLDAPHTGISYSQKLRQLCGSPAPPPDIAGNLISKRDPFGPSAV